MSIAPFLTTAHKITHIGAYVYRELRAHYALIGSAATAGAAVVKGAPSILRKYQRLRDRRLLKSRIGAELYTRENLLRATEFYIEADCQSIDPSGSEEFRKIFAVREPAHLTLDKLLDPKSPQRYSILLADSGMGKSTLLLNFYARYCRRFTNEYKIALVPLGAKEADRIIDSVADKTNTVLLLDAFDEDTKAIADHRSRLGELLELAKNFSHVLITCRTQFFERDDEIPKETGIIRIGITNAGEERVYSFFKIYLSPFSDEQIDKYIRARFPFYRPGLRSKAKELSARIPDLTVRPMLLAHVDELLRTGGIYTTAAEIYDAMIDAWLTREKGFVNPDNLRRFSIALAKNIYMQRQLRGSEKIPPAEALKLATIEAIPLQGWQVRSRSLLNRDAEGNLKFSHRTFMEFLFIKAFMEIVGKFPAGEWGDWTEWTDQMKRFWWDLVCVSSVNTKFALREGSAAAFYIAKAKEFGDLRGFFQLRPRPLIELRSSSSTFTQEQAQISVQAVSRINISYQDCIKQFPCFMEAIETNRNIGKPFIVDYVTGLMWDGNCVPANNQAGAIELAQQLDRNKLYGYSGWRLPTIEEALSLLPNNVNAFHDYPLRYPFLCFPIWETEIWTIDVTPKNLAYRFHYRSESPAKIGPASGNVYLRCVRTHNRATEN